MKLGSAHISMIGVGVSAVAAIAMIVYYRHKAATPDAAPDTMGAGAFPYFQTAALPTGGGGGGSGTTVSATPAASSDNSTSSILDMLKSLQVGQLDYLSRSDAAANSNNFTSKFASIMGNLLSQNATELSNIPGGQQTPNVQAGFAIPLPGGGFQFGTASGSVLQGLPNNLGAIFGSPALTGAVFGGTGSVSTNQAPKTNSTNSTMSTATLLPDGTIQL